MSAIHGFWQFYDVLANQIPGKPPMLAKFYGMVNHTFLEKSHVKLSNMVKPCILGQNHWETHVSPPFFHGFSMNFW